MSITRLQQARQMYAMGQRVAKTLDGSRPGYRGDAAYRSGSEQSSSIGQGHVGSQASFQDNSSAGQGFDSSGRSEGAAGADRSHVSDLQNYRHNVANRPEANLPPQLQPPIELNKREQALQNFLDYRAHVPTYGLMKFFQKPIQAFSDFNASVNRPFFEKVIRAGKIPGLNFDMTQQQFEDAYQRYMSNRLAGKTDAYGNPMQGFQYGDNNVLTGRFDNSKGDGIMSVDVDETTDDTTDDTTTDNELILRFLGADSTLDPAAAGLASTEELRNMLLERAKNLYKT